MLGEQKLTEYDYYKRRLIGLLDMTKGWPKKWPLLLGEAKKKATSQFKNILVGVTITLIKHHDWKQSGVDLMYVST